MRATTFLTATILAASSACVTDAPTITVSEHGAWEVVSATRNHRPTGLLNEAYLRFDTASAKLMTNLTGEELSLDYTISPDGTVIDTRGSAVLTQFEIVTLNDTTLTLQSQMMNVPFTLKLRPSTD